MTGELRLERFDAAHAATVLGWVSSDADALHWASLSAPPDDPAIFQRWFADPDVEPWLYLEDGRPVAYGEVWRDGEEAELARVLVAPACRGRGIGRAFVAALADRCRELGLAPVWMRVHAGNAAARAAYAAAGFVRADAVTEAGFNTGQPIAYVWMRR